MRKWYANLVRGHRKENYLFPPPAPVVWNSHRFLTTFAVAMLEKGVAIESVSKLLGHQNTMVTQKHYASWIKSRQDELEIAVRKSWM